MGRAIDLESSAYLNWSPNPAETVLLGSNYNISNPIATSKRILRNWLIAYRSQLNKID
jgi:hypothetical protein